MELETVKEMNLEIDKQINPWAYKLEVDDEYNYLNKILSVGYLVVSNAQLATKNNDGSLKLIESFQKNNEQCLNNSVELIRSLITHAMNRIDGIEQRSHEQFQSNQERIMDMVETFTGKTKTSQSKGAIAENFIEDTLVKEFPNDTVDRCSGTAHEADMQLLSTEHPKIIIESKNYTSVVQSKEIDKLKKDMETTNIQFGLFISLNSKITGKKHMEIERFDDKLIMYISNIGFNRDFITMSVKTMIQISKIVNQQETSISKELIADKISNVIMGLQKLSDISASLSRTRSALQEEECNIRNSLDNIHAAYINNEADIKRIINQIEKEINTELCTISDINYECSNNIEKIVSDVDEKKQPLVRNIVTQLIANGYTLDLNKEDGLYDILKNKTQQLVSKFNIKQSRLTIPNLRCQFDFRRKNDISNLDSFFQILEKL